MCYYYHNNPKIAHKQMKKSGLITIFCLLAVALGARAEEVSFRAQAPSQVIVGKAFQLTYTVNQRARDIQVPEFTDFDFIAGPYQSQSSSTSFINGKRTSTFTLTYTYTLMATKEGSFTLPPATIRVDGDSYTSNGVKITVLPPDEQPTNPTGAQGNTGRVQQQNTAGVSSENIFIRTIVSKSTLHEQEALLLTYKLYFAGVDVAQFTNNTRLPEFTGFLKQDLEQGDIQTELEHYNGRNYQTAVLYRTLLYPQRDGDIQIDPASFEAVLRVEVRQQVRSIFDDFFGSYTTVTKQLTAPGVTIHSQPLPTGKPKGFSGGVGRYDLKSDISATELTTNEAVTIKLTLSGNGNIKVVKNPAIDWPEGFETYDPKVTNSLKTTTAGTSGTRTIEYLAIPRAAGTYTIPQITFSYFDTATDGYKQLTAGPWTLNIKRGAGDDAQTATVQNYVGKENIRQLGSDIRYIHTAELTTLQKAPKQALSSATLRLLYLIPLIGAIVLFIVFRRRIRENADGMRMRYKKAGKVAQKRLRDAKKQLESQKKTEFYEAIEKAALTYLSDRLSIPTSELNKENISAILKEKNVDEEIIKEAVKVLSDAEFARYAPTSGQEMQAMYDQTTELINKLENETI